MTPDEVIERLRQASVTLQVMQVRGCWPKGYGSSWPDVVRDWLGYGYGAPKVRPALPSQRDIDQADEAVAWLLHIPQPLERRIVWACCVTNPVTGEARHGWAEVGRLVGMDWRVVKRRFAVGIAAIVKATSTAPSSNSDVDICRQMMA